MIIITLPMCITSLSPKPPGIHAHFTDKETKAREMKTCPEPLVRRGAGPSCGSPPPPQDEQPNSNGGRRGGIDSSLPELPWAGLEAPEAPRVGVGRGKAVNWFGVVGLSCHCRWPPPLSSCVTEECSYSLHKGSFVWRPQEGGG